MGHVDVAAGIGHIKHALDNNNFYGFKKWEGRVVVYEYGKVNLFRRFVNFIFHKEQETLAKAFAEETIKYLNEKNSSTVKENIREVIKQSRVLDPFNTKVSQVFAKALSVEINTRHETLLREFAENFFSSSVPTTKPLTLSDAVPFLDYYVYASSHPSTNPVVKSTLDIIKDNLASYFKETHQGQAFEDLYLDSLRNFHTSLLDDSKYAERLRNNQTVLASCVSLVKEIATKLKEEPKGLVDERDLAILDKLKDVEIPGKQGQNPFEPYLTQANSEITNRFSKANETLKQYHDFLHFMLAQKVSDKTPGMVDVDIAKARKILLEIELGIGSELTMHTLTTDGRIQEPYRKDLANLIDLFKKNTYRLDQIVLKEIKREHDSASFHPKVVIEGAGPTGLMLGLTQFQAGADVSIFEKRSTEFERTQVVRLDRKWMSILKFYLGTKYDKLFLNKGHKGIVRPDGFGEITTKDLEDVLNQRFAELMSLVEKAPMEHSPAERLAAHELTEVIPSNVKGSKFLIKANYREEADIAVIAGKSEKASKEEMREVDMLICAGGKSSVLKNAFLPSSAPVTEEKYYGVCSWLTEESAKNPFTGQDTDKMDYFQDFRGMIHINHSFLEKWQMKVTDRLKNVDSEEKEKAQASVKELKVIGQPYLQTRTFENKGLIYIGMELPEEFRSILDNYHDYTEIKKAMEYAWFDTVAENYQLKADLKMDEKFVATFPVEQNRLAKAEQYSVVENGQNPLLIVAAGDAKTSPHFMRYSGLSGAREDIFHLQHYMRERVMGKNNQQLLPDLAEKGDKTADFVIKRGAAFLQPKTETAVNEGRRLKLQQILDDALNGPKTNFQMDNFNGQYKVTKEGQSYTIVPKDGYLEVTEVGPNKPTKHYQSFAQLKLELGLN